MLTLLIAATLGGGCQAPSGYGYNRQAYVTYGATPTYYTPTYYTPTYYTPTYQAPQVDYKAVVGEYLREEYRQKAQEEQAARLARIEAMMLQMKQAPPPVQAPAPQPQFQAPYPSAQAPSKAPPVQFEQPFPTAQQPTKAPPDQQFQYPGQPSQQQWASPSGQQWAPSDQPPYAEKPAPSPTPAPLSPSFQSSAWVPPPTSGGGAAAQAVALMTAGMQARCTPCHVGTSSDGGGVKLLEIDGTLADITPYLGSGEGGIEKAVSSGRMPKKGPRLNNQELYAFLMGLRAYEAQSRARQNVVASFGQ
jgi:hypothetical protein